MAEARQAPYIGGVRQIGLHVHPWRLALVDEADLEIPGVQWEEHVILDPGLETLADFDRTNAEVKQRREALGRECVEQATEPEGLGFEHRDLAHCP